MSLFGYKYIHDNNPIQLMWYSSYFLGSGIGGIGGSGGIGGIGGTGGSGGIGGEIGSGST